MKFLLPLGFFFIVLLESTILSIPLTLIVLLLFFVFKKSSEVFLYAFIAGLLLDITHVRTIGVTSIFFVLFLFLVSLYDKKYEICTVPFVMAAALVGSLANAYLFGHQSLLLQGIFGCVVGGALFMGIQRARKKRK